MDFSKWDQTLRELLQEENLVRLNSGRYWSVNECHQKLALLNDRIFDKQLDLIREISILVLSELDPKFDLEPDKHYCAEIYDKKLRYSDALRQGVTETLVWLGIHGDTLNNCSIEKRRYTALLVVREIFSNASWQLWGSVNALLPALAEAAPDEFLDAVEATVRKSPSPFDELFRQEGDGMTGGNYMTGLYWALEGLAWDEKYLSRVCLILAELAEHDPGGKWVNRPANSIISILLPWHPQTLAPIEKRIAAVKAICKDSPTTAWKVLLNLLPKTHQSTSGTHKPKWRNPLPDDWKPIVTNGEYWDITKQYAEMTVEMACEDLEYTKELVGNMDNLPEPSFEIFLNYLASDAITNLDEESRTPIWEKLSEFANKHKRFKDAKWALPPDLVNKLEEVSVLLSPQSEIYLYERLFGNRDFELYEENGDWKGEQEKLAKKRLNAIQEIFEKNGLSAVIDFSEQVENSRHVGFSLGCIDKVEIDNFLLPGYLLAETPSQEGFIGSFIWGRHQSKGWRWVDEIDKTSWTIDQICSFLVYLPFVNGTWHRASQWLGENERSYWERANVNPYATDDDLIPAIDKLLEYGRPVAVIDCLYCRIHRKLPLDIERSIKALSLAVSSPEEKNTFGFTHATDLITALQENPDTPPDEMAKVEFAYLPLLQRHNNAEPKYLHKRLSSVPEFFCEIISLVYRSKDDPEEGETKDQRVKDTANNAWHLLHDWQLTPGTLENGSFSIADFLLWFDEAKKLCEAAGRLEIALSEIGKILFYTPKDPDGFWIDKGVLDVLDDRASDRMRDSFRSEVFNSRGAHWVDPTGAPERELAAKWRKNANDVEQLGYTRFSTVLKNLADSYDRDAERIIREHGREE